MKTGRKASRPVCAAGETSIGIQHAFERRTWTARSGVGHVPIVLTGLHTLPILADVRPIQRHLFEPGLFWLNSSQLFCSLSVSRKWRNEAFQGPGQELMTAPLFNFPADF